MSNPLSSLRRRDRSAMAGLLLSALAAAPLQGCLIPQDDQVIPELPPKRNSLLSIVDFGPEQKKRLDFYPTGACASPINFFVTVSDLDRGDIVRSMWFVDQAAIGIEPRPLPLTSGRALVQPPTSIAFTGQMTSLSPDVHTLTVYVTDSTFDVTDNGVTAFREPIVVGDGGDDAGVLIDPAGIDTFTWILDVKPCQ